MTYMPPALFRIHASPKDADFNDLVHAATLPYLGQYIMLKGRNRGYAFRVLNFKPRLVGNFCWMQFNCQRLYIPEGSM